MISTSSTVSFSPRVARICRTSAPLKTFIEIKEESESYHDGAVAFLVENSETLDEILESTVLLLLGAEFDVVDELVEVAGLVLIQ